MVDLFFRPRFQGKSLGYDQFSGSKAPYLLPLRMERRPYISPAKQILSEPRWAFLWGAVFKQNRDVQNSNKHVIFHGIWMESYNGI